MLFSDTYKYILHTYLFANLKSDQLIFNDHLCTIKDGQKRYVRTSMYQRAREFKTRMKRLLVSKNAQNMLEMQTAGQLLGLK